MKRSNYTAIAKSLGVSGLQLFQAGVKPTATEAEARRTLEKMGVFQPHASTQKSNVAGWDDLVRAGVAR